MSKEAYGQARKRYALFRVTGGPRKEIMGNLNHALIELALEQGRKGFKCTLGTHPAPDNPDHVVGWLRYEKSKDQRGKKPADVVMKIPGEYERMHVLNELKKKGFEEKQSASLDISVEA